MEKSIRILIVVVVLGIAGYFAYDRISTWHEAKVGNAVTQEKREWQEKVEVLEEKITDLQHEVVERSEAPVPKEKLIEVFGQESPVVYPGDRDLSCEQMRQQITSFFSYLDKKDYIRSYELDQGTFGLFLGTLKELSANPPMVTDEMKDLSNLLRNVAHFYRALGRKRVEIIAKILKNESEIIESISATFFTWFTLSDCCKEWSAGCLSLPVSYEYAGFFLNTLAGRSYLLRRDSRVRILATYYFVLILDKANDETLNLYGIDIRPHINTTLGDIRTKKGLMHKKQYLGKLEGLGEKYQM